MARLANAPVCFTLAQMRFNEMLDMDTVLPALQGAFHKAGFPDYTTESGQNLEFRHSPDGDSFQQKRVTRHVFRNKQQSAALILDTNALTYELTDYPVFDKFSKAFLDAVAMVAKYRGIDYYDRLGMRMLDAIQPLHGDKLAQYVTPEVLGFANTGIDGLPRQNTATESVFKDTEYTLTVRTRYSGVELALPTGLSQQRVRIQDRFLTATTETIMLDSDAFMVQRTDFNITSAKKQLTRLKRALSQSFEAVVTKRALQAWK